MIDAGTGGGGDQKVLQLVGQEYAARRHTPYLWLAGNITQGSCKKNGGPRHNAPAGRGEVMRLQTAGEGVLLKLKGWMKGWCPVECGHHRHAADTAAAESNHGDEQMEAPMAIDSVEAQGAEAVEPSVLPGAAGGGGG